ncbi:MAG: shikimate kinase [Marinosulfonomonas sp.]|nr:shikimate kinase [Marinosulfonomonas sp.]
MKASLNKTVVLVGMMGAGKTAVGKALAARLEVPFLDSDEEIVKAANMSIAEVFTRDGEAFFRSRETEVITRLLDQQAGILSTGGGAFLAAQNRKVIADKGVAVWLRTDLDLLWARVRNRTTRPLLHTDDPYATLRDLCVVRNPLYAKADLVVQGSPKYSIEDMVDAVIDALKTRPDVLETGNDD